MQSPDISDWTELGVTSTVTHYIVEPGILAAVALPDSHGTVESARENIAMQHAYFLDAGPGAVIYFADHAVDQDHEARRVYRAETDPSLVVAVAIVATSLVARAIASFYVAWRPPKMPFRSSPSYEDALGWVRSVMRR